MKTTMQPLALQSNDRHAAPFHGRFAANIPVETLDHARDVALSLLRTFADRPSYVLGVTSALPGEGKTTISIGLAEVMATDFGLEVVLLDTNAERPWAPDEEEWTNRLGLSDWLSGECALQDALAHVHDRCSILPFGTQTISSRDVLQYLVKHDALAQLREQHSLIVLDLPDLMNPAAAALANLCDGLVLVIHAGSTSVDRVRDFLPILQNVTLHGAVLNRHRSSVPAAILRAFS